ncbi:MAG: hypothetical protein ACRCYY_19595 [Trueperaceae bacterium]
MSKRQIGLAALGRPGYIDLGHHRNLQTMDEAAMGRGAHDGLEVAYAQGRVLCTCSGHFHTRSP